MGFLDRFLGKRDKAPAVRPLTRDAALGVPLTDDNLRTGPFPRELRVRAVYEDYALYGSWQVVTLRSIDEWAAAREQVLEGYYQQFGLIRLADGTKTIRWNELTWRNIRGTLEVLYDPRHAGAQAFSQA